MNPVWALQVTAESCCQGQQNDEQLEVKINEEGLGEWHFAREGKVKGQAFWQLTDGKVQMNGFF